MRKIFYASNLTCHAVAYETCSFPSVAELRFWELTNALTCFLDRHLAVFSQSQDRILDGPFLWLVLDYFAAYLAHMSVPYDVCHYRFSCQLFLSFKRFDSLLKPWDICFKLFIGIFLSFSRGLDLRVLVLDNLLVIFEEFLLDGSLLHLESLHREHLL